MIRLIPDYLKNRILELPIKSGVYLFKNREGRPVYIGKALSIRKRVLGHFRDFGTVSKEGVMLGQVSRIDFVETPNEAEALLLEASLVKEIQPRYNKELKDDKSYPFLKITAEEYPRLLIVRGRKSDGGKYFGPYTSVRLLHQAVKMLRREFPMRTCKKLPKKVCLMYHLKLCEGPCEGLQDKASYLATVRELENFLEGRRDALVRNLSKRMKEFSAQKEYEKAQQFFQEIQALSAVPAIGTAGGGPASLTELKNVLGLPVLPARMECFDISNIQGREAVGSMVVFVDGRPARNDYRHFRIRTVKGIDDYEMMREVVGRRYARALAEKQALPGLIVIDGGKGHLAAARTELEKLSLGHLPVISLAKQHEYIFSPGREAPHVLPQSSPALLLLRHLRDEAHRFAIQYHRRLHKKEALLSVLDRIPGVGPKTRARLLKRCGTVSKMKKMTSVELAEKTGLSDKIVQNVLRALK